MHKLAASTLALLMGAAWTVAPAIAQTTGEKIENKAERAGDKIEDKAERAKDKIEDKADSKMDKVKEKAREAKNKIKEEAREAKDKIKAKTDRAGRADNGDVRSAQQALRDKGHDPGPIDGVKGPKTTAAVRAFQKAQGVPDNGNLDATTMEKLGVQPSASPATESAPAPTEKKPQTQ